MVPVRAVLRYVWVRGGEAVQGSLHPNNNSSRTVALGTCSTIAALSARTRRQLRAAPHNRNPHPPPLRNQGWRTTTPCLESTEMQTCRASRKRAPSRPPTHGAHGTSFKQTKNVDTVSYRNLAIKWHPMRCSEADAEARFDEVSEAFEVLSNCEGICLKMPPAPAATP
eukprot:SAG31_NODE_2012_length_6668_cov_5.925407_1_plen_168_part_00